MGKIEELAFLTFCPKNVFNALTKGKYNNFCLYNFILTKFCYSNFNKIMILAKDNRKINENHLAHSKSFLTTGRGSADIS